jgi:hypothetical protein
LALTWKHAKWEREGPEGCPRSPALARQIGVGEGPGLAELVADVDCAWLERDIDLRVQLVFSGARQGLVAHWHKETRSALQALPLDRLNAALPHPRGEITVAYRRDGAEVGASVTLPAGLTGDLIWGGKTCPLASGAQELNFPVR